MPLKRAQNERLRGPPPGCGALRLEPVALLYFFLPAAVSPPLRLLCLPILRETFLLRTLFLRAIILRGLVVRVYLGHTSYLPLDNRLRSDIRVRIYLPRHQGSNLSQLVG